MNNPGNPIESLAEAVYSAKSKDLPNINYKQRLPSNKGLKDEEIPIAERRPYIEELIIHHFIQTWPSTALGFGGMGGSAMTSAYTTVVICKNNAAIYFDGRLAYVIESFIHTLIIDMKALNIKSVSEQDYYRF